MPGNIGCFNEGCSNPVVGQCSGHRDSCGQFYCHEHSFEKLCSDCGREKKLELTYEDYVRTAQGIYGFLVHQSFGV